VFILTLKFSPILYSTAVGYGDMHISTVFCNMKQW